MKIAQIADLWHPVSKETLGGRCFITSVLTDKLVERGHDVTLFASGDSQTSAKLISVIPRALHSRDGDTSLLNIAEAYGRAEEFDVIHNHLGHFVLPLTQFVSTPTVTTIHYPFKNPVIDIFFDQYKEKNYFTSLSYSMREQFPGLDYVGNVYNGIVVDDFVYQDQPEDFVLFFGRMSPDKGVHLAIEAARLAGERIVIVGLVPPDDEEYFNVKIKPLIDNDRVKYLGAMSYQDKISFFGRAKAMLHPALFPEPFGLTLVEAMACGTPVIAYNRGAIPEVIDDKVTGFVVSGDQEMADAIKKVGNIKREACRQRVEKNFTVDKMVDGYLAAYDKAIHKYKKS